MGKRIWQALAWLWPFVVAVAGVVAILAGLSLRSDSAFLLLFFAALLGSPVVVATIAGWLPTRWSAEARCALAIVLTLPVVVLELWLALMVLAFGANTAGPGLIELDAPPLSSPPGFKKSVDSGGEVWATGIRGRDTVPLTCLANGARGDGC